MAAIERHDEARDKLTKFKRRVQERLARLRLVWGLERRCA